MLCFIEMERLEGVSLCLSYSCSMAHSTVDLSILNTSRWIGHPARFKMSILNHFKFTEVKKVSDIEYFLVKLLSMHLKLLNCSLSSFLLKCLESF